MKKEHFKGIIWPRETVTDGNKTNYRYVVVGMLITETPIEEFENQNEVFLDGLALGATDVLGRVKSRKPFGEIGDATNVLSSLSKL